MIKILLFPGLFAFSLRTEFTPKLNRIILNPISDCSLISDSRAMTSPSYICIYSFMDVCLFIFFNYVFVCGYLGKGASRQFRLSRHHKCLKVLFTVKIQRNKRWAVQWERCCLWCHPAFLPQLLLKSKYLKKKYSFENVGTVSYKKNWSNFSK